MAPRGALSGSSGSDGWRPPSHSEAEVGDTCAAAASSRAPEVRRVAGRGVLRCPAARPAAPVVLDAPGAPGAPGVSEVVMMPAQLGVIPVCLSHCTLASGQASNGGVRSKRRWFTHSTEADLRCPRYLP